MSLRRWSLVFVIVFMLSSLSLRAQIHMHVADVAANGGATDMQGQDNNPPHYSFGFTGVFNLTHRVGLGAEYTRIMLGQGTSNGATQKLHSQDIGAVFRYYVLNKKKISPYLTGAGGVNFPHSTVSSSGGTTTSNVNGGYWAVGAGVSLFLHGGLGIRPEFRYKYNEYPPPAISGTTFSAGNGFNYFGTVAVFYQF